MSIQHDEARRLLPVIIDATKSHRLLDYQMAAAELGRSKNNARMVAQVCDLLDAAAALAGVPLLALWTVREASGHINRKAWTDFGVEPELREAIIECSRRHDFTQSDFDAIADALRRLDGKSNRAAWAYLRQEMSNRQRMRAILERLPPASPSDAIDDIGSDRAERVFYTGQRYARDQRVRDAVMRRAGGQCEYCGARGFKRLDGTRYLEAHHILALANDGEDRMTNVIAICPGEHREVHFGERRDEMEREMIVKVEAAEAVRRSQDLATNPAG
jgi:5-methylcytosine-specific restriction endonuclease McrA